MSCNMMARWHECWDGVYIRILPAAPTSLLAGMQVAIRLMKDVLLAERVVTA